MLDTLPPSLYYELLVRRVHKINNYGVFNMESLCCNGVVHGHRASV